MILYIYIYIYICFLCVYVRQICAHILCLCVHMQAETYIKTRSPACVFTLETHTHTHNPYTRKPRCIHTHTTYTTTHTHTQILMLNGYATYTDLKIDRAAPGARIRFSMGGFQIESDIFAVALGAAATLVVDVQPKDIQVLVVCLYVCMCEYHACSRLCILYACMLCVLLVE